MAAAAPAKPKAPTRRWGMPGVSEREYLQDTTIAVTPNETPIPIQSTGILASILHRINGTATVTLGGGTAVRDNYGPYNLLDFYQVTAGGNTPIVSTYGEDLNTVGIIENTGRSLEAVATTASVVGPVAASDYFNVPTSTGTLQFWLYVPIALPLVGAPGGAVGYLIPQNRRVTNILKPRFSATGAASPFTIQSLTANIQPYLVTGAATVTFAGNFETWKELYTVPNQESMMPLPGYTRQIMTVLPTLTSAGLTYDLPAGGTLLRAFARFLDSSTNVGFVSTAFNNIVFQYGATQIVDNITYARNEAEALLLYGRTLPQGVVFWDYYTRGRSFREAKSMESSANPQFVVSFASGFTPGASSICALTTDKIYIVRNRRARMG